MTEQEMLTDSINELKTKIHELITSNEVLKNSIGYLNAAVNDLTDAVNKKK